MSTLQQNYLHIAAALIQRDDEVLLVEQQWPNAPSPTWTLPGGRIEPGELLVEAMCREVQEETGLEVTDPGQLLYTFQHHSPDKERQTYGFVFAVAEYRGEIEIADPDNLILSAHFLPRTEAIARLSNQRLWRAAREPIVAYLQGEATPGATWLYRHDELILRAA